MRVTSVEIPTQCSWIRREERSPVRIGAVYPLTGPSAPVGTDIRHALDLAAEIVNEHFDLTLPLAKTRGLPKLGGRRVEIVWADSESRPDVGAARARELIENEKVVALIGSYESSVTAAASVPAEERGVPFLNPESSSPVLTQQGFEWFFRTGPSDTTLLRHFFELFEELNQRGETIRRIAILSEDGAFGRSAAEIEKALARELGYEIVAVEFYTSPSQSLSEELIRIRNADPDVILGQQFIVDAIQVIQRLKALNWFPDALVVDDAGYVVPDYFDAVGDDSEFVISRVAWALGLGEIKPLVYEVNALYRARYGVDMDETNARSFTGLLVLADAINRAGDTTPRAVREALRMTDMPGERLIMPWEGVRFSPTGQNVLADGLLAQAFEREYRVVWPFDLAEIEIVWPTPNWDQRV